MAKWKLRRYGQNRQIIEEEIDATDIRRNKHGLVVFSNKTKGGERELVAMRPNGAWFAVDRVKQ